MAQYLVDNDWIFDTRYNLHRPTTGTTGRDVDIEDTLQSLRPSHRHMALARGLVFFARMLLPPLPPPGRRYVNTVLAIRGKDTVEACKVHARFGYQCRQPSDEVQRLEQNMGGAVPIRGLELVANITIGCQRQTFLRNCRSRNITA